jgi:tetratricopeptide (TPR) repeat protein
VKRRIQLGIFCIACLIIFFIIQLGHLGCAGSSKALSPERQKAIQDSLMEIHRMNVLKTFSSGYEHYKHGNYERAKPYLRKTAEIDTTDIYGKNLYQYLGRTYVFLNMPDSAEWAFQKGKARNPKESFFCTSLAYLFEKEGRLEEAIAEYESALKIAPDSVAYYSKLGQLYTLNGDNEKAIEALRTAVLLNPDDKKSAEILDQLIVQTGNPDEIISQREAMVQQFPNDMKLRMDFANSLFKFSKFERSIEQLIIIIDKEPENILAIEMLGESYQQLEKYQDAVSAYHKILNIQPEDMKNLCNLALAYGYQGKYVQAMGEIRKAQRIDPNYGLAFLTKGIIYETAAEKCVAQNNQKISFNDKLVYKMAYDEFQKAKNDLNWKDDANRHIRFLDAMIPTAQDRFFHKNQTMPRGACYSWIK